MNNLVAAAAAMENDSKLMGTNSPNMNVNSTEASIAAASSGAPATSSKRRKNDGKDVSAAKARRLEQNRRAAVESRRRKKIMTEELQRSVAFYTKANATLVQHNRDLEHRLILAKQRLQEMGTSPFKSVESSEYEKSPLDVVKADPSNADSSNMVAAVSDTKPAGADAPLVRTQADMKNALSSLTLLADDLNQKPSADAIKPSPVVADQVASASADNESEDEYLKALKRFAAQQSAIATAAAASANAAYQAIKYHEMMKKNGQSSGCARFPFEQFLMMKPPSSDTSTSK